MDFFEIIQQLGFPAAIAAYALWNSYKHEQFLQNSLKKSLEENTRALEDLKLTCAKIVGLTTNGGGENEIRRSKKEN